MTGRRGGSRARVGGRAATGCGAGHVAQPPAVTGGQTRSRAGRLAVPSAPLPITARVPAGPLSPVVVRAASARGRAHTARGRAAASGAGGRWCRRIQYCTVPPPPAPPPTHPHARTHAHHTARRCSTPIGRGQPAAPHVSCYFFPFWRARETTPRQWPTRVRAREGASRFRGTLGDRRNTALSQPRLGSKSRVRPATPHDTARADRRARHARDDQWHGTVIPYRAVVMSVRLRAHRRGTTSRRTMCGQTGSRTREPASEAPKCPAAGAPSSHSAAVMTSRQRRVARLWPGTQRAGTGGEE